MYTLLCCCWCKYILSFLKISKLSCQKPLFFFSENFPELRTSKTNLWYALKVLDNRPYMQGPAQRKPLSYYKIFYYRSISMQFYNITISHSSTPYCFRWNVQIKTINYYTHIITPPTTLKRVLLLLDPVYRLLVGCSWTGVQCSISVIRTVQWEATHRVMICCLCATEAESLLVHFIAVCLTCHLTCTYWVLLSQPPGLHVLCKH